MPTVPCARLFPAPRLAPALPAPPRRSAPWIECLAPVCRRRASVEEVELLRVALVPPGAPAGVYLVAVHVAVQREDRHGRAVGLLLAGRYVAEHQQTVAPGIYREAELVLAGIPNLTLRRLPDEIELVRRTSRL